MTNSDQYKKFKELYYSENLTIKSKHIKLGFEEGTEQYGEVVFENDNGEDIEISGTEPDFVHELFSIKTTYREGEKELIDLAETNVDSIEEYHSNVKKFVHDDMVSEDKTFVEAGIKDLEDFDEDFEPIDLYDGLDASISGDMRNENLQRIVENYHAAVATQLIELRRAQESFEYFKSEFPRNEDRFQNYSDIVCEILQKGYFDKDALNGYSEFREITESDLDFLVEKMRDNFLKSDQEWKALSDSSGGGIDGSIGYSRILEDYHRCFELISDPLRDLAATLDKENGFENINLSDTIDVLRFLKRNGYQNLVGTIDPDLRRGPAHMSTEVDLDNEVVKVYDKRGKGRTVKKKVGFKKMIDKRRKMMDLVSATIVSFMLMNELLVYRYISSNEFRFNVIEKM